MDKYKKVHTKSISTGFGLTDEDQKAVWSLYRQGGTRGKLRRTKLNKGKYLQGFSSFHRRRRKYGRGVRGGFGFGGSRTRRTQGRLNQGGVTGSGNRRGFG
ncbi:hypothetical protein VP01_8002g2, partial [Puccinia sorghi]